MDVTLPEKTQPVAVLRWTDGWFMGWGGRPGGFWTSVFRKSTFAGIPKNGYASAPNYGAFLDPVFRIRTVADQKSAKGDGQWQRRTRFNRRPILSSKAV